jgi:hypothetical protein
MAYACNLKGMYLSNLSDFYQSRNSVLFCYHHCPSPRTHYQITEIKRKESNSEMNLRQQRKPKCRKGVNQLGKVNCNPQYFNRNVRGKNVTI